MAPLALVLQLALASPGLVPPLDPGPLQAQELVGSSLGVLGGDALVLGAGYATLQLFAAQTISPTATHFRQAAYGLAVSAVVVPPLTAMLLARWMRAEPASGSAWKAFLLAAAGQAVALAAGYAAYPRLWVVIPVQLLAVGIGTSIGLHWGSRGLARAAPRPAAGAEPSDPPPAPAVLGPGFCPDPALASTRLAAAGP